MNVISPYRVVLIGVLGLGVITPVVALRLAFEVARSFGIGDTDPVAFVGAESVLGCTAVAVGVTILWRKPGNRIGIMLAAGGLLLMSVFTAWVVAVLQATDGDPLWAGIATWWGTLALLPAIVMLFPAVGILFPDERLPGPRWRRPIAIAAVLLAAGVVLQSISPWRIEDDFATANPIAINGVPVEVSELGGALSALATFMLLAIAVAAVIVRYRRSTGVERAQQKWLVASLAVMALAFPFSFATDVGPDEAIDILSVLAGALVPIAVGIAVLRYHVFEIDRVVSRTIGYGLLTAVLIATYAAVILVLQGPLGDVLGGDTISVALSTLVVAALFQPLRRHLHHAVDRRFDRARFDADRTTAAFSDRLRDEVDIEAVTDDLDRTVRDALKPSALDLWLRDAGRVSP